MKQYLIFFNFLLVLSAFYVVAALVYALFGFPYRIFVLISALVPLLFLTMRVIETRKFVDNAIESVIGNASDYSAYTKNLPGYRFVDIHNAVARLTSQQKDWVQKQSHHHETLANILNGEFFADGNRRMKAPERIARRISEHHDGYFPADNFWVQAPSLTSNGGVIRVKLQDYTHEVILEVASKEQEEAENIINRLLKDASEKSIYKNKVIQLSFEQEVKDSYGDIERHEKVDPIFLERTPVTASNIILDEDLRRLIKRCVIDFHRQREKLMSIGLPGRRGVLFYGPPGTGKTYTSRYISHQLETATTIVATGMSLLHIKSICNVGRMLQPSLVILEDIDLVYSSRDQNIYTTALGELMDELDGFNAEDNIIFILTTNAIDRVERAIRERPGRISQCIYFGPPVAELRLLHLESLLARYDSSEMNMDQLVQETEGVTQAFLKELVYRAVQMAAEDGWNGSEPLALSNLHFRKAMDEMRSSAGHSGEAIIGFRVEKQ